MRCQRSVLSLRHLTLSPPAGRPAPSPMPLSVGTAGAGWSSARVQGAGDDSTVEGTPVPSLCAAMLPGSHGSPSWSLGILQRCSRAGAVRGLLAREAGAAVLWFQVEVVGRMGGDNVDYGAAMSFGFS